MSKSHKKKSMPDGFKDIPWFKPDGSKKDEPIKQMTREKFFEISRELEDCHSIFYKFWEVGTPIFTRSVDTAAVAFNPKDGAFVSFVFNPDFWEWLDDYSRRFIIAHEMAHLILRHGLRVKDCHQKLLSNACLDVVVNHLLVNKFGFQREKVKGSGDICWIDTVFDDNEHYKGPKAEEKKNFEYYYLLAKKHFPKPKRVLKPGMIVWNRKTKKWGKIVAVDEKKGKTEIRPMSRKAAVKECKENYKKMLEQAKKMKEAMAKQMQNQKPQPQKV